MDADDAVLFGFVDDAVYIKVGTRIGAQQNELLRSGGRRGRLVHVGCGHGRNGVETFTNGAADTARGDTAVRHKDGLALEKLLNLSKALVGHVLRPLIVVRKTQAPAVKNPLPVSAQQTSAAVGVQAGKNA